MKNRGQLFDLHADLDIKTKKLKLQKPAKKNEPVSKASSTNFYEEEQSIQLSGPGMFQHQMSETWTAEAFESNTVEEADYSIVSSYTNDAYENDDHPQQMSGAEHEYLQETPTYQAVATDTQEYAPPAQQPSFLDEITNLASEPAQHKPRIQHPDPLKALGEAVKGMSDDDFAADLAAILEGNKVFDPEKKELVSKDKVDDEFTRKLKEADSQRTPSAPDKTGAANANDKDKTDPNAIFEKIAQNMSFANSFDLGDFEMEQRFDGFDTEILTPPTPPAPPSLPDLPKPPVDPLKDVLPFSTEDFVKDLDQINVNAGAMEKVVKDKNWPAAPTDLTQPSAERTKLLFGSFEYEADATQGTCGIKIKGNWEAENITEVDIPQLTGKTNGSINKEIKKGSIRFNKKAAKQLQKLWQAWETAGLLDRIVTYDGGFVPRFIKRKDGTCATTLSNHSWGSAFDINAAWNGLGAEPALVGQKGCVRELVEIANQHGFYWGGHFGTKDGMHFEVAKIIE